MITMQQKKSRSLIIACLLALSLLAGCSSTKTISGTQRDEILAYADPASDHILQGMNNNDYPLFSQDFDEKMKSAIDEKQFPSLEQAILGKVGKYVSRKVESVVDQDQYFQVIYNAKFEQDDPVLVRVVFAKDSQLVSGLFFDSAKLRQK